MNKVKWGVLGTADIAHGATIPGMLEAGNCELRAIAGRSLGKAQQFQREFGFEKAYGSYDELLADPEVQAVYVPLPNSLHREWAVRALRAGKHVLCEKPLALTAAEAEEMFRAAEENGVYLMEAFAYLHNPFVSAVKAELDAGALGEIRYLASSFIGGRRPDTDIRLRRETGGGAMYDLGCYPLSLALWLLGRDPEDIRAMAQFSERHIDLFTSVMLLYPGSMVAKLDCGMQLTFGRMDGLHIFGTEGELHSPVEFNQSGEISYTLIRGGHRETKTVTALNNYRLEVEQLGRCVLGGEKPHVTREFSLRCARVADRVLQAIGY